jgi:hypothetical protein
MILSHFIFILVLCQSISTIDIEKLENVFINDADSIRFSVVPCRRRRRARRYSERVYRTEEWDECVGNVWDGRAGSAGRLHALHLLSNLLLSAEERLRQVGAAESPRSRRLSTQQYGESYASANLQENNVLLRRQHQSDAHKRALDFRI